MLARVTRIRVPNPTHTEEYVWSGASWFHALRAKAEPDKSKPACHDPAYFAKPFTIRDSLGYEDCKKILWHGFGVAEATWQGMGFEVQGVAHTAPALIEARLPQPTK